MVDENSQIANLTPRSIKLDPQMVSILENSQTKKFIGSLLSSLIDKKIRKVAVLSWDNIEGAKTVAQILAVSLTQQLDQKCAVVQTEGIRYYAENYAYFGLVSVPEISGAIADKKIEQVLTEVEKSFPILVILGPEIKNFSKATTNTKDITLLADAQILVLPESGVSRDVLNQIDVFTKTHNMNWLGILSVKV